MATVLLQKALTRSDLGQAGGAGGSLAGALSTGSAAPIGKAVRISLAKAQVRAALRDLMAASRGLSGAAARSADDAGDDVAGGDPDQALEALVASAVPLVRATISDCD